MKDKERAKILARAIYQAVDKSKDAKGIVSHFLLYLKEHRLVNFIPEILKELERLHLQTTDTIAASVSSKENIDDKTIKQIVKMLETRTKKNILVKETKDEAVIGGLVIKYQDRLIDLSIKQQLKLLNKQLIG